MMTYIIIKMHCKRRVQIQDLQGVLTVRTRRAHNAPTAPEKTPRRCHNVPTARCLTRCVNAAALRSRRLHSVSTALLATAQRAPRRSATFLNAVETL